MSNCGIPGEEQFFPWQHYLPRFRGYDLSRILAPLVNDGSKCTCFFGWNASIYSISSWPETVPSRLRHLSCLPHEAPNGLDGLLSGRTLAL